MSIASTAEMWKTIEDVDATFDSLSLINRGKPSEPRNTEITSSPHKLNFLEYHYVNEKVPPSADCDGFNEDEIETNDKSENGANGYTMGMGRGLFIKEWKKISLSAQKDAIIQAELDELFPYSFSNEAIEKSWAPVEKVEDEEEAEKGQFEDEEIIDECVAPSMEIQALKDVNVEVRPCSPPFAEKNADGQPLSTSPLMVDEHQVPILSNGLVTDVNNEISVSNGMDSLENLTEDECEVLIQSINKLFEEKPPNVRPKKCRNALLNSLNRKEVLGNKLQENDEPLVLKKPSDFLVSTNSNSNNSNSFGPSTSTFYPSSVTSVNFFSSIDDGSFVYCEDDFPTL